ncbi:MAG: lysylphosphatidylglycerol synthase transmembrane domain-containing protein [Chloroflexia bacterium]
MKRLIVAIGILISIGALYLALKDINFADLLAAFGRINPALFALGSIPWAVAIGSKVFRWRLLYYPDEQSAPFPRLTAALLIGYLFNTVLPLRTGEVVRATVLRATAGLPVARTLSTILVEKVLDTMALIAMLGLLLPFISLPVQFRTPALLAALLFGGLFVVVMLAALFPDGARGLIARCLPLAPARFRPAVFNISNQVLDGLLPLRRREVAPRIIGWTVLSWATNVACTYIWLLSFGLVLPLTAPLLVVDATNIVMTVPSAPGYVGVYHETAKEALRVFGVDPNTALAFATLLHAVGFGTLSLAGLVSMVREGLSWGGVQGSAKATSPAIVAITPNPQSEIRNPKSL